MHLPVASCSMYVEEVWWEASTRCFLLNVCRRNRVDSNYTVASRSMYVEEINWEAAPCCFPLDACR